MSLPENDVNLNKLRKLEIFCLLRFVGNKILTKYQFIEPPPLEQNVD